MLTLIAVSSVAIVVFATRAVLQANRPIVDLLHLVGARDGYIARQIDGRFLQDRTLRGTSRHGPGPRHLLSSRRSPGQAAAADLPTPAAACSSHHPRSASLSYALLFAVPVMATLISLITSRVTLMRMLGDVL